LQSGKNVVPVVVPKTRQVNQMAINKITDMAFRNLKASNKVQMVSD